MQKILPVIMCGGAGTRMWPESREQLPKQFIPLLGDRSTFQDTIAMLANSPLFDAPLVITNNDYAALVAEQVRAIGAAADIVLEPMRRDSGPAVGVAAEIAFARAPDTVVAVLAADHAVVDRAGMVAICAEAASIASDGFIVTLGIAPSFPATGYGYIRTGERVGAKGGVRKVAAFVEKPDAETAQRYIDEGYLWNSGNFIFRADVMRGEILHFEPGMAQPVANAVARATRANECLVLDSESFGAATKKSIDFAVMERTSRAAVIPADIGWSDVGTWSAVRDLVARDGDGNAVLGDGVVLHARNAYVRSQGLLTTVVGVSDVIVVSTPDAVLVLSASHSDRVKDLVDRLKTDNRREIVSHKD
jgi:mannose-1-phosphate guanylyltransferase/mannose-6-phosphate isomerase